MSQRPDRIAALAGGAPGKELDERYLSFFACFNQQKYFEAHEVLEGLWLGQRHSPDGAFYQGLIQLAGAFVHAQKRRPGPAAALFRLARANLSRYPGIHRRLDVNSVSGLINAWLERAERSEAFAGDLNREELPVLELQ
jgi:predicted metal-dependent hydrolase